MRRYVISIKVGRQVRKFRKLKNVTQEELAGAVKIHVSTLGRIERGESNPPLQTIDKIARALKVKTKDLM
jgi:transcriptional regulator with XRE-family HTH domain